MISSAPALHVVAPRTTRSGQKTYRLICPTCLRSRDVICSPVHALSGADCKPCANAKKALERRIRWLLTKLPPVDSRPLHIRALERKANGMNLAMARESLRLPDEPIPATVNSRSIGRTPIPETDCAPPAAFVALTGGFLLGAR